MKKDAKIIKTHLVISKKFIPKSSVPKKKSVLIIFSDKKNRRENNERQGTLTSPTCDFKVFMKLQKEENVLLYLMAHASQKQ